MTSKSIFAMATAYKTTAEYGVKEKVENNYFDEIRFKSLIFRDW